MKNLLLLISLIIFASCHQKKITTVKLTFCDDRDPVIKQTNGISPCNIITYKQAVPLWKPDGGYGPTEARNVCDCDILK